jgi:2-methylisocitrate lyase-like PEP mutase family enzyme
VPVLLVGRKINLRKEEGSAALAIRGYALANDIGAEKYAEWSLTSVFEKAARIAMYHQALKRPQSTSAVGAH